MTGGAPAAQPSRALCMRQVRKPPIVAGIGLTGQMHGLVLLNSQNKVIRPALIWCDQRSQKQVDFVNTTLGKPAVLRATANPVLTGFTLPKLLWGARSRTAEI